MLRPASRTAALTLAAATTAVAVLTLPTGATAAGNAHTVHVTTKRAAEVEFGRAGFTEADTIQLNSGKTIGTSVSDCTPRSSTKAACTGAIALKGGLLDARFTLNFTNGDITGKITGGTVAFKRATGTIAGTSFNGGSHLTVTYH